MAVADAGITSVLTEESNLEITCRESEIGKLYFIMNFCDETQRLPKEFIGKKDLITDITLEEGSELKKYDVKIVRIQ